MSKEKGDWCCCGSVAAGRERASERGGGEGAKERQISHQGQGQGILTDHLVVRDELHHVRCGIRKRLAQEPPILMNDEDAHHAHQAPHGDATHSIKGRVAGECSKTCITALGLH